MPATLDVVTHFATEAARFREWARDGNDTGELAVRHALIRILALYLAGLDLPPEWSDELADAPDAQGISSDEGWAIYHGIAARLPFSDYARVFDPFVLPPEEPVVGSIADDVADIYDDVVGGLIEYEAGRTARAIWEWGFSCDHTGDDMRQMPFTRSTFRLPKTHGISSTLRLNQSMKPTAPFLWPPVPRRFVVGDSICDDALRHFLGDLALEREHVIQIAIIFLRAYVSVRAGIN